MATYIQKDNLLWLPRADRKNADSRSNALLNAFLKSSTFNEFPEQRARAIEILENVNKSNDYLERELNIDPRLLETHLQNPDLEREK